MHNLSTNVPVRVLVGACIESAGGEHRLLLSPPLPCSVLHCPLPNMANLLEHRDKQIVCTMHGDLVHP